MGRRKIEIQPITHERNRSVTFLKRKNGLFKKAYELGVLCSVDVAVVIFGQNHKLYEYCSGDGDSIARRRVDFNGDRDLKGPADFGGEKADAMDEDEDEQSDDPSPPTKRPRTTSGAGGRQAPPAKIKAKPSGHVPVAPKKSDAKLSESPPTPPPGAAHPSLPPPIAHLQLNLSSSRGGPYPRDPSGALIDARDSPPGAVPHISYYHPNYHGSQPYSSSHDRRGSIPPNSAGGRYDNFAGHSANAAAAAAAWKLAHGGPPFRTSAVHEDHYRASSGDGSRSSSPDDGSVVTSAGPTARVHSIYASHPFDLISTGGKSAQLPSANELDWPATAGAAQSYHRSQPPLPPPPASAPAASSEGSWLDFLSTPTPTLSASHHHLAHHPPPFATAAASHFTPPAIAASNQPHAQLQAWERQWRAAQAAAALASAGVGPPNGATPAAAADLFPFDVAAVVQDLVRSATAAPSLPQQQASQQRHRLGSDPPRPASASATVQRPRRVSNEAATKQTTRSPSVNSTRVNGTSPAKPRLASVSSAHAEETDETETAGVEAAVNGAESEGDDAQPHGTPSPPASGTRASQKPITIDIEMDIEGIALASALASVGADIGPGTTDRSTERHSSVGSSASVAAALAGGTKDEEVDMALGI